MKFRKALRRLARSPAEPEGANRESPGESKTFRVSGVPVDWNQERLQSFLTNQTGTTDAIVKSLAREANSDCQTATVMFENTPLQLEKGPSWHIQLPEASGTRSVNEQYINVEKDFLGITTLYAPPPRDHKIDVVALSGLGGHAFGSFKQSKGAHMWLRDSLPGDLTSETNNKPMARVMIYGYESAVAQSKNMQNLEDLATTFHSSLLALAVAPTTRPIILIGHSLGGLIIKQVLISLSRSSIQDDKKLIRAVYGVIFFGTPHDGMDIRSLIPMVGNGPNRFLVESISHINSQILSIQQRDFHNALGDKGGSEVFCFYETVESPTAQQDEFGCWRMIGPTAVLVTKSSATHCRSWENGAEYICAIARTHSNMVKFGPHDPDYRNVRERIRGLSRRAFKVRSYLTTTTAKFLVPYTQNPDFVGRSEILNYIKQQFSLTEHQEPTQSRRRISLYGLGGVGKTQIALAYVYWLRETCPDISIFWVHASNADRFRATYASIAEKCDVPGSKDPKADVLSLVKKWLEEQNKMRWLMIVDNADDMELFSPALQEERVTTMGAPVASEDDKLARYLPDCNYGWILITTRNKQAGIKLSQGKSPIEVAKMTDSEAYRLVKAILPNGISKTETSALSSRLEHLPLALAQATSYIQGNGISISDYINLLDESDSGFVDQLSEPFETVGRDSETPHAVTATWIISFRQVERNQVLASDILYFMSLLHCQAIPRVFLEKYYRQRTQEQTDGGMSAALTKALGTLKAFCFISEGKDRDVDMHRLVQLVTRKWLISNGRMAEFTEYAIEIMSALYPYGKFETREICLRYLPHTNFVLAKDGANSRNENRAKATLLHRIAGYFLYRGEWKTSEDFQKQAMNIRKRVLGGEHPDTLASMNNLASTYGDQGRWKEAEDLQMQVLEISKKVLGKEHLETLISMNNLASTYWNQGRWKEAEGLEIQVFDTRRRVLGEEHPATLTSMGNLASIYRYQGRWKGAEDLEIQVLEISQKVIGEEHPDTVTSMSNLASTYWNQGRWKEAEGLDIQVLELRKRVLGEEHPDTLASMNNLASTYTDQGRWKEAEDVHMQVLETSKKVLGEEHPATLTSMNNLAFIWKSLGRSAEAVALMEDCLSARERILGQNHPRTVSCLSTLDGWLQDAGDGQERKCGDKRN
ncbi:hypothetical protein V8C37DRAFT_103220 [Trichoderma ceciliae]